MSLVTIGDVKAWGEPGLDSLNDTALTRCIDAAEDWLERVTGRVVTQTEFTRYFSGRDAVGACRDTIYLNAGHRPVIHSGSDLVVVTEDGVAVTVAIGYSATADAILVGVNEDRQCAIRRNYAPWSGTTYDNVKVVYKAGWTTSTLPDDVEQLLIEVAWLMFRSPKWVGQASISRAGGSASFEKELTPQSAVCLATLRGL